MSLNMDMNQKSPTRNKIIVIARYYDPDNFGGAEVSTKLFTEDMAKNNDVLVITSHSEDKIRYETISESIRIVRVPNNKIYWSGNHGRHSLFAKLVWHLQVNFSVKQIKVINGLVKEFNPDFIFLEVITDFGSKLYKLANQYVTIPVLRDYDMLRPTNNNFINRVLVYSNKKRAENIKDCVAISHYTAEEYRRYGFFTHSNIQVIGNIVRGETLTNSLIKKANKKLVVGYFGQLSSHKGVEELISALLKSKDIVEKAVFVGEDLENFSEKYSGDLISFKGKVSLDETYQLMAQADVVVVPSKWGEPFGRVVIEAYRQRCVVITSNNGALPELNIDKELILKEVEESEIKNKLNDVFSREFELTRYEQYSLQFVENIGKYNAIIDRIKKVNEFKATYQS